MRFKDAVYSIKESMGNLGEPLLLRDAYRQLDAYLKNQSWINQQLSEKNMEVGLNTSEITGSPVRFESEIKHGIDSFYFGSLRNELREIGLLNFLKKHPKYMEILYPSKFDISHSVANYKTRKIQQHLQKELN